MSAGAEPGTSGDGSPGRVGRPRRPKRSLAAVVSVRFDPAEVRLLRRLAPGRKVSAFVREATMNEARRVVAATGGGGTAVPTGAPAGAMTVTGSAGTTAPSTRAYSMVEADAEGRSRPPAMWDDDHDRRGRGQAETTRATAKPS